MPLMYLHTPHGDHPHSLQVTTSIAAMVAQASMSTKAMLSTIVTPAMPIATMSIAPVMAKARMPAEPVGA